MAKFNHRSEAFLRDLSRASAWMIRRNVGETHWWRWQFLTDQNPDSSQRPVFDPMTAKGIFDELIRRGLLVESVTNDATDLPAYVMRYDKEGWERAVSDGRPLRGAWFKFKQNWFYMILACIFGSILTLIESRTMGLIEAGLDAIVR